MTEEKKVITIDDVEYTEDQLSDKSKMCINHINSLDQKIGSAEFNLDQLRVGRNAFMDMLKADGALGDPRRLAREIKGGFGRIRITDTDGDGKKRQIQKDKLKETD